MHYPLMRTTRLCLLLLCLSWLTSCSYLSPLKKSGWECRPMATFRPYNLPDQIKTWDQIPAPEFEHLGISCRF